MNIGHIFFQKFNMQKIVQIKVSNIYSLYLKKLYT
jgi:hypothetical protein